MACRRAARALDAAAGRLRRRARRPSIVVRLPSRGWALQPNAQVAADLPDERVHLADDPQLRRHTRRPRERSPKLGDHRHRLEQRQVWAERVGAPAPNGQLGAELPPGHSAESRQPQRPHEIHGVSQYDQGITLADSCAREAGRSRPYLRRVVSKPLEPFLSIDA